MGMFDSKTEKLDLDPRVDIDESNFALQNFLHKFAYPIILIAVTLAFFSLYLGYLYIQVSQINKHNTALIITYMKDKDISVFSKADSRYKSFCYSTSLIELIQTLRSNPESLDINSKYRLLRLLKTNNAELEKLYKTLSPVEKKIMIEQIYVKLGLNISPAISKEININKRVILSEIGSERPININWELINE